MEFLTTESNFLDKLRKRSFSLKNLPDEINIGSYKEGDEEGIKPLLLATVDDIAFAQQHLNRQLTSLLNTFDSIRNLHDMARSLGAKGTDYALEFIREYGEEK